MSSRTLLKLLMVFVVLVALLGIGRFFSGIRFGRHNVGDPVLRRWDVNEVEEFDLVSGDERVYLARQDGRWIVHSRFDYAADFPTVARALRTLSELKIGRVVPDGTDHLADFGLDPRSEEEPPLMLVFRRQRGRESARMLLGSLHTSSARSPWGGFPGGRFLRVKDGPVMLVNQRLDEFSMNPDDWIRKDLISVPAAEIATIVAAPLGSDPYEILAQEDGSYTVADLWPEEEVDESAAGRMARSLQNLRCTTVADPDVSDAERGFDDPSKLRVTTRNGIVYSLRIGGASDSGAGHYVRIAVSIDPTYTAGDVGEEGRLTMLQNTLHGWTFVIPSFQIEAMRLPRDQVVTAPDPEPDEEQETVSEPEEDTESGQEPEESVKEEDLEVITTEAASIREEVPGAQSGEEPGDEKTPGLVEPPPPVVEPTEEAPEIDVQLILSEEPMEAAEEFEEEAVSIEPESGPRPRRSFDLGAPRPAHVPPSVLGPRRELEP